MKKAITIKDIKNYVEGNLNMYKQRSTFIKLPIHIQEQAVVRAFLCAPCLKAGACSECGCSTPELFYAPKKVDEMGKWGEMYSAEEWEEYKKEQNLTIPDIDLAAVEVEQQFSSFDDIDSLPPWERNPIIREIEKTQALAELEVIDIVEDIEDETEG